MKNYLDVENSRNHKNHKIYERFLKKAIHPETRVIPAVEQMDVIVGHHIVFLVGDEEPNEIPSADCLLFDPDLMKAVFKEKAMAIMLTLCHRTPEERDLVLNDFLDGLDAEEKDKAAIEAVA